MFNQNYHQIQESDWLLTGPILAQIGQCTPHRCTYLNRFLFQYMLVNTNSIVTASLNFYQYLTDGYGYQILLQFSLTGNMTICHPILHKSY